MDLREWLLADGLGGFTSGTVSGVRTRRYHALLCAATRPPVGRMVLVNGFDAFVVRGDERIAISTQHYSPGVDHPDGASRLVSFEQKPWPTWRFKIDDGLDVVQEIRSAPGAPLVTVTWKLVSAKPTAGVTLEVRPFLSGRDYHALHYENGAFGMAPETHADQLVWRPYPSPVPPIFVRTNGAYTHDPAWYKGFLYEEERARGLDHVEDCAAPGVFRFDLSAGRAEWVVSTAEIAADALARLGEREQAHAAASYLVARHDGKSIIAGYPWFSDWGRDTFIAMRGLSLATGRLDDARKILVEWAGTANEGMLPNRFPDLGEAPEYNSVDAGLWFIVAAYEYLQAAGGSERSVIQGAIAEILSGCARGTTMNIRADSDGLLAAGAPGWQLTWMDARVDGVEITPRIGKPVEVQALWVNALEIGARLGVAGKDRWADLAARARASFADRFWNQSRGCLHDVVDVDHRPGATDASLRPNQILAVGGLPFPLLDGARAASVVAVVEERLLTPLGLRTLAHGEPGYFGRCEGDARWRDRAYHNGTVWPWLMGPFIDAWLRVHGDKAAAKQRFLEPLRAAMTFGHLPEIADGDAPHTPRGCPQQAWSLGEFLRVERLLG